MKKFFAIALLICVTFLSGFVLTACGESSYNIYINLPSDEESLYEVVLKNGDETLQGEQNIYKVDAQSNLKVEIVAKCFGVDFSNLKVKVGELEKAIVENGAYSSVPNYGELTYGYFTLVHINSNMEISISGAKLRQTTFTFEAKNLQQTQNFLALASVNFGTEDQYINLKEFLLSENPSFVRSIDNVDDDTSYKTFKMKLEGGNSLDLSAQKPFKIKTQNGIEQDVESLTLQEGVYVVDMGNINQAENYTIVVDFSNVRYTNFAFIKPQENLTYSVDLESETTNFTMSQNITVNKLSKSADYANMALYCNSTPLEVLSSDETKVVFAFPEHSTPMSMGGDLAYILNVRGISFDAPSRVLSAKSDEIGVVNQLINFQFKHIADDGRYESVTSVDGDGNAIALQGEKVALVWSYEYNDAYYSKYDLANYDLLLNEEKILNVQQLLGDKTATFETTIEGGYLFKATFNDSTLKFDKFALEFVCGEQDCRFSFENFTPFYKNINISYSFEDDRIESVEFAIQNQEGTTSNWTTLTKNTPIKVSVIGGNVVKFRFKTTSEGVGAHEFNLTDTSLGNKVGKENSYVLEDKRYVEICFQISELQFENTRAFKLVASING